MRFIASGEADITLASLERALRQTDPGYEIKRDNPDDAEGCLMFAGGIYGEIEVNRPGDDLFAEELEEMKEFIEEEEGEGKAKVLELLTSATAIVAVQVLSQGRELEETLGKIDPLWEWLFANATGFLQADGEGYYDSSGLILEVE